MMMQRSAACAPQHRLAPSPPALGARRRLLRNVRAALAPPPPRAGQREHASGEPRKKMEEGDGPPSPPPPIMPGPGTASVEEPAEQEAAKRGALGDEGDVDAFIFDAPNDDAPAHPAAPEAAVGEAGSALGSAPRRTLAARVARCEARLAAEEVLLAHLSKALGSSADDAGAAAADGDAPSGDTHDASAAPMQPGGKEPARNEAGDAASDARSEEEEAENEAAAEAAADAAVARSGVTAAAAEDAGETAAAALARLDLPEVQRAVGSTLNRAFLDALHDTRDALWAAEWSADAQRYARRRGVAEFIRWAVLNGEDVSEAAVEALLRCVWGAFPAPHVPPAA